MIDHFIEWAGASVPARSALANWGTLFPLHVGDELAALAIVRGTEIHFAASPKWRRRLIHKNRTQRFLAPLMARYGFLTTRSAVGDTESPAFLQRLGFVRTWCDGVFHHWMLTELPFTQHTET